MIPARKSATFNAWFAAHARSRIHGTFGRVLVHGLDATRALARDAPLLLVANHSAWWDALVALHFAQHVLELDGYAMMDERNLAKLPFFSRVGAFGVDLESASGGAASLRYTARLLAEPGRAVWIFAQGRERPITERPLAFEPGAAAVLRIAKRAVGVPVGIRYEFGEEEHPSLFVSFGAPIMERGDILAHERGVELELERIERACRERGASTELSTLYVKKPSAMARLASQLLVRLTSHGAPPSRLPEGDPRDRG